MSISQAMPVENFRGSSMVRASSALLGVPLFFSVFPALVLLGGSTDLLNWGPGILVAGLAGLLLVCGNQIRSRGMDFHACLWFALLALLFLRALNSPAVPRSAISSDASLMALAGIAYFLGKSTGALWSRALFVGLAVTAMLHVTCIVIQTSNAEWNLIYPQRSGMFPAGLFSHYNYGASFCLGTLGLLISRSSKERGCLRYLMIAGALCALGAIPLSLSRGGNLALATLVATCITLLLAHAFRRSVSMLSLWLPTLVLIVFILISGISLVPLLDRNLGANGFYADGGRISFWQAALHLTADRPWFGGGADSFATNAFLVMNDLGAEPNKVHNEALQLAVDYGYPALVAIAVLIFIPIIRSFWHFANGTDSEGTAWECVGLIGMLAQSNFSFIFHTAPGVFLAGIILGRISYGLWPIRTSSPDKLYGMGKMNVDQYRQFLIVVKHQTHDYFSGRMEAILELTRHLNSQEEPWETCRNNLIFFTKTKNPQGLSESVNAIKKKCLDDLMHLSQRQEISRYQDISIWRFFRKTLLVVATGPMVLLGASLTHALVLAWQSIYGDSKDPSSWEQFHRMIVLKEKYPHLGIERKILTSAIDCIYQFNTADAREYWAERNERRIRSAVAGAERDPAVALQLATILGWSGNVDGALGLYDQAIKGQGGNESLFMAHAFKGQYCHELSLSESTTGEVDAQERYAEEAVVNLLQSQSNLKKFPWKFTSEFASALVECQSILGRELHSK
jgi:O-antigen ligase